VIAVMLAIASPVSTPEPMDAIAHALVVLTPIAIGLHALHRGAATRFAFLLLAAGFFWAPTLLTMSDGSLAFTIGRIWTWLLEVTLVYLVLAFPSGRITTTTAKRLVIAAAVLAATLYLPTALLVEHFPEPSPWNPCDPGCPANALMLPVSEPGFIDSIVVPVREVLLVLLYAGVAGYLGPAIMHDGGIALVLDPAFVTKATARGRSKAPTKPERRQPTVLVVDDQFTVRELQRGILESAGYDVKTARDGREALTSIEGNPDVDLVVTDVQMPEMDGIELLRAIREDHERTSLPVVIVTSQGSEDDRRRGLEAGADAYIVKDQFDQRALIETVEGLLTR